MNDNYIDPLVKRAVADAVLERATIELKKLLQELASAIEPFPHFMGVSTIQGIEVDPQGGSKSDIGCVLACPDGELRELVLRMIPGPVDFGVVEQIEEMKEVDLSPTEFIAYAYSAVQELTKYIEEH